MTLKEHFANILSGLTGIFGLFGSWNVCHQLCMVVIGIAAVLGISATGMPFGFLQPYALPLWSVAVVFFAISIFMFFKMPGCCMSREALIANFGILVFAVPFTELEAFKPALWAIGGLIIVGAAVLWLIKRKKYNGTV